jgi:hypothetical protein
MSKFKNEVNAVLGKIEIKIGAGMLYLDAHAGAILAFEQGFLKVLESPGTPLVLSTILPAEVISEIPQIENFLTKAIADTLVGTKILNDVNAQTTLQGKLEVLATDIQSQSGLNKGIVRDICLLVLSDLNNSKLTAVEYQIYLGIKEWLNAA